MGFRKTFVNLAVLILVGIVIASGCTEKGTPTETTTKPVVAVYASPTDFPTLDPSLAFESEAMVLANVYEALVKYDPYSEERLKPWLAERWEVSEDGLVYTFYLRKGVKFHDGAELTAEVVKKSIERTIKSKSGPSYIYDPFEKIEVVDKYTVRIYLKYPAPAAEILSSQFGAWIMSPNVIDKPPEWFNEGHDGGTGPYMIESYEKGRRLVLTKFEEYWGGWEGKHIDKVIFEIVTEPTTRLQMIETGEADVTIWLPPEALERLKNNPDVEVLIEPDYKVLVCFINTQKPPLDNKLVRQALSYAVPYDAVINATVDGLGVQARGPIPSAMFGHIPGLKQYTYNPPKAKELLEKAGYPHGFNRTLVITYTAGNTEWETFAEIYKNELANLNITLELSPLTISAKYELARGDPTKAQDFTLLYWWPTYITPYDYLYSMFHSEEKPIFNLAYYKNPEFDKLIDEAFKYEDRDPQKALELYREAQEILVEDAPAIFLYETKTAIVKRKSLKGFKYNPAYTDVVFFYECYKE